MANDFRQLLAHARQRGIHFHPLGDLAARRTLTRLPTGNSGSRRT